MSDSLFRATKDEKQKFRKNYSPIKFRRWQGSLTLPKGQSLDPHQEPAIRYALNRNRCYLALAPGLGKSIIAALIASSAGGKVLVICPKALVYNMLEEFQKWAPKLSCKIMDEVDWIIPDILIVPDSIIDRYETRLLIRYFSPENIIIDEARRYKEMNAQRTQSLLGFKDKVEGYIPGIVDRRELKHLVYMDGTPAPNGRPIELYPIIAKNCPEYIDFKSKIEFGISYCNSFYDGRSYNFNGTNIKAMQGLKELMISKNAQDRYGFMLLMDKSTIKLPPLAEEVVTVGDGRVSRELKEMQNKLLKKYSIAELVDVYGGGKKIKSGDDEVHIATFRRLMGISKVKPCAEYLKDILNNSEENILVFCIHDDVMIELTEMLSKFDPLLVSGKTPMQKRHGLVKEFQTNKKKRLFIAKLQALGYGHTLTKADRVSLVEWSYVPGENRQGIDRAHRRGRNESVLGEYLAANNTIDKPMLLSLEKKEKNIKAIL